MEVIRVDERGASSRSDECAVEAPLEIQLNGKPFHVTMRTPGDDIFLVAGFLFSEGIIDDSSEILMISQDPSTSNRIHVQLAPESYQRAVSKKRNSTGNSSCGVCGSESLAAIRQSNRFRGSQSPGATIRLPPSILQDAEREAKQHQTLFRRTGGTHAALLFRYGLERTERFPDAIQSQLIGCFEDVGRHNAFDKLLGFLLQSTDVSLTQTFVIASGRASFELVQKSALIGIPIFAAIGAPSTLAVEVAEEASMTLIGFLRSRSFNVYTHPERIGEIH